MGRASNSALGPAHEENENLETKSEGFPINGQPTLRLLVTFAYSNRPQWRDFLDDRLACINPPERLHRKSRAVDHGPGGPQKNSPWDGR